MNILTDTLQKVENGEKFSIDFKERTLKVGNNKVINKGVYDGELGYPEMGLSTILSYIEFCYARYKHSIPSARTASRSKVYFKALPERELSDYDMMFGEHRERAQFMLEYFVLAMILLGTFQWEENFGKWYFWQSTNDKDLVVLREWIA